MLIMTVLVKFCKVRNRLQFLQAILEQVPVMNNKLRQVYKNSKVTSQVHYCGSTLLSSF